MRQANELVDVELVVGEDDEVLEMTGRRARIVLQPHQRQVDARRGEQGQRPRLARHHLIGAVGDAVVEDRQVRHVEDLRQARKLDVLEPALDMEGLAEREMDRNRRRALAHLDRPVRRGDQKRELLLQIATEDIGPGDGGGVDTRVGQESIGGARIDVRQAGGGNADDRIAGAHAAGEGFALGEGDEGLAQHGGVALVEFGDRRDGRLGVVEASRKVLPRHDRNPARPVPAPPW